MRIKRYETSYATDGEIGEILRRENAYWKTVELSCRRALAKTKYPVPLPSELNAGIAFFTESGENWAATWLEQSNHGERVRPSQFEGIIHNAPIGFAAIALGLIGPQIALVSGHPWDAARIQLESGRSRLMLVGISYDIRKAEFYVLEAVE